MAGRLSKNLTSVPCATRPEAAAGRDLLLIWTQQVGRPCWALLDASCACELGCPCPALLCTALPLTAAAPLACHWHGVNLQANGLDPAACLSSYNFGFDRYQGTAAELASCATASEAQAVVRQVRSVPFWLAAAATRCTTALIRYGSTLAGDKSNSVQAHNFPAPAPAAAARRRHIAAVCGPAQKCRR